MSVFLCLGDYQWLGVWCVWLGDCFWVSLCVCLSVCVFVIMCVYIYSVSTCVCDKCFPQCLTKNESLRPLHVRTYMSGSYFRLVFHNVCLCWCTGHQNLFARYWHMPRKMFVECVGPVNQSHATPCGLSASVVCVLTCFLVAGVCVFVRWGGQECGGASRGASDQQPGAPLPRGSGIRAKPCPARWAQHIPNIAHQYQHL